MTSQVLSEDEDTFIDTREFLLPLASPSARDSSADTQKLQSDEDSQSLAQCVVEAAPEKLSKQHILEDDEWCVRGDGGHVMSEMESSEDVQVSPEAKSKIPSKEQRPDVHCMSSKSKVNHEPVAPKKKSENSSSQSQSYIDASSTASARNNVSSSVSHN